MRHIWKPCATSGEGWSSGGRVGSGPAPASVGRWLWGLPRQSAFHSPDWRTLPARHFICKNPPSRLPPKYLPAKANFAPPASCSSRRQGVQGFDPAVKYPSVSIRRGLTEVPAFINTRQVSLNPRGCFHSHRLTAWRDFSIGSVNAPMTPSAGGKVPRNNRHQRGGRDVCKHYSCRGFTGCDVPEHGSGYALGDQ